MNDSFYDTYDKLLRVATEYGGMNAPLSHTSYVAGSVDKSRFKQFIRACHNGYEKAQRQLVSLLEENRSSQLLPPEEKIYRELVLRKAADSIAYMILRGEPHVMRRLSLQTDVTEVDLRVVRESLKEAEKLNAESRLTFALLTDLTTFIQVCDILRVDFRKEHRFEFIELKTGRINALLMDKLQDYEPVPESSERVAKDNAIDPRHKAQADRIIRQRVRLARIDYVLHHDEGYDIQNDMVLKMPHEYCIIDQYDDLLEKLCERAFTTGRAAATVERCIHLGVGFGEGNEVAGMRALDSLRGAFHVNQNEMGAELRLLEEEMANVIPNNERVRIVDLVHHNLNAIPTLPLPLWRIKRRYLRECLERNMRVFAGFDVAGFMWLSRHIGLDMRLSSRKEAAAHAKMVGGDEVITWGGRGLAYNAGEARIFILGGFIARFFSFLICPGRVLAFCAKETPETLRLNRAPSLDEGK